MTAVDILTVLQKMGPEAFLLLALLMVLSQLPSLVGLFLIIKWLLSQAREDGRAQVAALSSVTAVLNQLLEAFRDFKSDMSVRFDEFERSLKDVVRSADGTVNGSVNPATVREMRSATSGAKLRTSTAGAGNQG